MSGVAIAAAALAATAPLQTQVPPSAEELVAAQQEMVRAAVRRDCPQAAEEEILICAGREDDSRYRLGDIAADVPAPAAARAGGAQLDAMRGGDDRCSPVGRFQQCTQGLDVIGIGVTVVRAVARAIARDDD